MVAGGWVSGDGQVVHVHEVHVRAGLLSGTLQGGHHRGRQDPQDTGRLRDGGEVEGVVVLKILMINVINIIDNVNYIMLQNSQTKINRLLFIVQ